MKNRKHRLHKRIKALDLKQGHRSYVDQCRYDSIKMEFQRVRDTLNLKTKISYQSYLDDIKLKTIHLNSGHISRKKEVQQIFLNV